MEWQPIETAPKDRSVLVIGGLLLVAGVFLWACIRLAAVDAEKGR